MRASDQGRATLVSDRMAVATATMATSRPPRRDALCQLIRGPRAAGDDRKSRRQDDEYFEAEGHFVVIADDFAETIELLMALADFLEVVRGRIRGASVPRSPRASSRRRLRSPVAKRRRDSLGGGPFQPPSGRSEATSPSVRIDAELLDAAGPQIASFGGAHLSRIGAVARRRGRRRWSMPWIT